MARIEAEAARNEAGVSIVRLRIEDNSPDDRDRVGTVGGQTLVLTVKEAVAARDALNRALNDLGVPDQD